MVVVSQVVFVIKTAFFCWLSYFQVDMRMIYIFLISKYFIIIFVQNLIKTLFNKGTQNINKKNWIWFNKKFEKIIDIIKFPFFIKKFVMLINLISNNSISCFYYAWSFFTWNNRIFKKSKSLIFDQNNKIRTKRKDSQIINSH